MSRKVLVAILVCTLCLSAFAEEYEVFTTAEDLISGESINGKGHGSPLYGVRDSNGNIVIAESFDEIKISEDGTNAAVNDNGRWGHVDMNGNWIVKPKYDWAEPFRDGYAVVGWKSGEVISGFDDGYCFGLIDMNGVEVIPVIYRQIERISNGTFKAFNDEWNYCIYNSVDGSVEGASTEKYEVFTSGEDDFSSDKPDGYTETLLYGVRDSQGKIVIPESYGRIELSPDGTNCAVLDGNYWGYMDMSGKWFIKPQYDWAEPFLDGYAIAGYRESTKQENSSDENYLLGVIDWDNHAMLPMVYRGIERRSDGTYKTLDKEFRSTYFSIENGEAREFREVKSAIDLDDYAPFTGSRVVTLDEQPLLAKRVDGKYRHPRLDGATALFPVYSAIAQFLYPEDTRLTHDGNGAICCTKTTGAYQRLIEGEADMIFCAEPSAEQLEMAERAGVDMRMTLFGKEAFVFIVNKDNPLSDISIEQIRDIYSGRITRWDELGVAGLGDIIAYQRPENSGSQTAFLNLMGERPVMEAPQELVSDFMEEIVSNIEYRNLPNAIGYSFRFFCTDMLESDVKLLSIDGVLPTRENIRSGAYPLISDLYCITRKGAENPNVQALLDWITGEQGQRLIEKTGYVATTK